MIFGIPARDALPGAITSHEEKKYASKVTAIALAAIAIVLFAASCALWGLGTSPGMMLTGMNFFPYLVGSVIGCVTIAVASGAGLFTLKTLYHSAQISRFTHALSHQSS